MKKIIFAALIFGGITSAQAEFGDNEFCGPSSQRFILMLDSGIDELLAEAESQVGNSKEEQQLKLRLKLTNLVDELIEARADVNKSCL